jgi:hypothetical protein
MNIDLEKYNDRGQFKVPEGYFDTLADRIMANIPEAPKQEKQKRSAKIISLNTRLKIAVAAAIVGAVVCGTTIRLYQQGTKIANLNTNTEMTNNSETYGEEYVNDYIDYAMVDGTDIYEYISEN